MEWGHLESCCNQDDTAKARAGGCSRHPGQQQREASADTAQMPRLHELPAVCPGTRGVQEWRRHSESQH